jgi:hypothetical protein
MKSKRLDGTWRGWLWMIGLMLIAFGFAMWGVAGYLTGEVLGSFTLIGPTLVGIGAFVLLVRAGTFPRTAK